MNTLAKMASKKRLRIAGLMSGTSADGIDAAIVDIENRKVRLLAFDTFSYPDRLRERIFQLFQVETARIGDISQMNFVLGEAFAEAVIQLCRKNRIALKSIDVIGSHGQTIYHDPQGNQRGSGGKMDQGAVPSTLQIGEPCVIAQRTGKPVVGDFRVRDIAVGGQGAPLVPYADYLLFGRTKLCRAIQNIGGIANVTYLPPHCRPNQIIAFDTGPGNMVIDRFACLVSSGRKNYDSEGKMASAGTVNTALLKDMLQHPFFQRQPPKTTGREEFGWQYCQELCRRAQRRKITAEDLMTTVTSLTAISIAQAYQQFLPRMPKEMIVCGGGSRNTTLVKMLRENLPKVKILIMDDLGINSDAKEAISFAILAYATIKGRANNIPTATGAKQSVILGKIIPA